MPRKPEKKGRRPFVPPIQKRNRSWGEKGTEYRSDPRYHTAAWTRLSRAFRADHPLCENCLRKGIVTPAEVVDHIVPIAICEDFWDMTNWQSLCRKCNIEKGNRDKRIIQERKKK